MSRYNHISVAIPILAEQDNLPSLLSHFRRQTFRAFTLYLCVNNEEQGYGFAENQESLRLLQNVEDLPLVIIDRSSQGQGWTGKKKGVGWARKLLFDRIAADLDENELVVSMDADTGFDDDYLESVCNTMNAHPDYTAFCVPYYHPLDGGSLDRPMLRYECYMRHYLIHLLRIGNPYAFTALGSAMAFPMWAYRRAGGITPLQGGEDFYLLQKLAKTGKVQLHFCHPTSFLSAVRPQGRVSARVPFGTGPAIAAGIQEMDSRYPFYCEQGFNAIKATYDTFPTLYERDIETPLSSFLRQQLGTDDLWSPLRKNYRTCAHFTRACAERVDGLRIMQYLKNTPHFPLSALPVNFQNDPVERLNDYRNQLFDDEMSLRQKNSSGITQ